MKYISVFILLCIVCNSISAQLTQENQQDYWKLTERNSIVLDLTDQEWTSAHKDNIELSGKEVSAILFYSIDEKRNLSIERDVIFPQLRIFNKTNEPDWKKYRAYFRKQVNDNVMPAFVKNDKQLVFSQVDSIEINGKLVFYHSPVESVQLVRTIYPSMEDRYIVEKLELKNISDQSANLHISNSEVISGEQGYKGRYKFHAFSDSEENVILESGGSYIIPIYLGASLNDESAADFNYAEAEQTRDNFLHEMKTKLVLQTPDKILNTLFYFSKIRASESIFNSSMGLVHSPGGGNYYTGIWANDQIEYQGPFTPYLGYERGEDAAYNAYKYFMKNIPEDGSAIPYAFEMDGNFAMNHLERGDAAMIAYGTSHYVLAKGDKALAEELWPLIEWSLDYCNKKRNAFGAVESESDEMEGRIETGTANLSTSSLYYGGLKFAITLSKALGKDELAREYTNQYKEMEQVIENYFGARLEGLDTYKYFAENEHLRHWICLPLCMGIKKRKEGTLKALFDKMWTDNGVLVELNKDKPEQVLFWDRATLYALRGAIRIGGKELGIKKLKEYSRKRLLGDHVPYVVEAYPENNMKHLSAESALYCRIFTEGILGIEITALNEFTLNPSLPKEWDFVKLDDLALFGKQIDIHLKRERNQLRVQVKQNEKTVMNDFISDTSVPIKLE